MIERMSARLPTKDASLLVPIGDDASLHLGSPEMAQAVTCDILAEDVHFRRRYKAEDIGWKSLAVNLSDLAAMGARPRFGWISLAIPSDLESSWEEGFTEGLNEAARCFGLTIAGGDTTGSSGGIFINVTVLGEVKPDHALTRSAAQAGDILFLSRPTGLSHAGFLALEHPNATLDQAPRKAILTAHLRPRPEVELGLFLAESGLVHACLDLSDGLAQDLGHLCEQSRIGAQLEAANLPISQDLKQTSQALSFDPQTAALQGGEDYALLFTVAQEKRDKLFSLWPSKHPLPYPIGRMVENPDQKEILLADGTRLPLQGGWDHFRS